MIWKSTPRRTTALSPKTIFALSVMASTAWTPVARASEFPAVISLSSLDGSNGFRLDGVTSNDRSGYSVASAGDVNGDGFGDVIVGTPLADADGHYNAGSSYIVFGTASGSAASIDLSALNGSNGFRLDGTSMFDQSGFSVAGAGDVNWDGFTDLIIGTPSASPHGSFSGSSYVVFGKASGFPASVDLSTLDGKSGFRLDGALTGEESGHSVSGAGDVNGDGFDDVIVGAYGASPHGTTSGSSYVVFGKGSTFAATMKLSALNGSNGFRLDGVAAGDRSGSSVAAAGDVNGDGFADAIIGAPEADPHGGVSGSTYVVFGKAAGFPAAVNLSSLNGSDGFRLDGVAAGDRSGGSVSGAGDVNGDGFADLIIGKSGAANGYNSGSSYVVFGRNSGFPAAIDLSSLDGTSGFRLDGVAGADYSGAVSGAGDVNGDGFADVIIGASRANLNGPDSGSSYVVLGKAAAFAAVISLSSLNGSKGFRLDGAAPEDISGCSVAGGDVNGDGFADMIVGARGTDFHGGYSGSTYVLFGRAPDSARTRVGGAAGQYISGGSFPDSLKGLDGNDTLEGRGGGDALVGGLNVDAASYLHSTSGVVANLANPGNNTGDAAGDSYSSVKNLIGSRFADELAGNGFSNSLMGDQGADVLIGAGGADLFVYNAVRDSPPGPARDKIADFDAGTATTIVGRIDLRAIDAKTGPGNQAFAWIGTAAFSNTKSELRVEAAGTSAVIQGDVDGDGIADLEIELLNFTDLSTLTAIDFRL